MLNKIQRSYAVMQLTRKYFRPSQIPKECCLYYINGIPKTVYGSHALTMLIGIVIDDNYGLKRFRYIDNIVDVGANIGIFSLHATTLFPNVRILAYEPGDRSREYLAKNLNQSDRVEIYPNAVGGSNKKVKLNRQTDLTAFYVTEDADLSAESQTCEMVSLDEITAALESPIGLLKLDCEGSEYEIMQAKSFEQVRYVVGELHSCSKGNPELGLKILEQKGFIIDKWLPFPDGKAGEFWASNSRNTSKEKSWLL